MSQYGYTLSSQVVHFHTLDHDPVDVQLDPVEVFLDAPDDVVYIAGVIQLVLLCLDLT